MADYSDGNYARSWGAVIYHDRLTTAYRYIDNPGGTIKPFWLAATVTSAPQSSIRYSSQPKDAMQSTAKSAG